MWPTAIWLHLAFQHWGVVRFILDRGLKFKLREKLYESPTDTTQIC